MNRRTFIFPVLPSKRRLAAWCTACARPYAFTAKALGANANTVSSANAPDIRLGHVVLLATDWNFAIFGRIVPRVRPIAESTTVYAKTVD